MPEHPNLPFVAPRRPPWRAAALAALVTSATLLAGCSSMLVHPDTDVSRAVAVPAAWDQGAATADPTTLAQWWQRFGDPQLADLVTKALAHNPDVRTAQASLRQAREQRVIAASGLYPNVGASGSASRSRTRGNDATTNYAPGHRRELGARHLRRHGRQRVRGRCHDPRHRAVACQRAGLDRRRGGHSPTSRATGLTLRLAIARDNLASQEETQQITEWRAQAGLATSLDVEQARTSTESTRAQIPTLSSGIAQAQSALAILTGATPESLNATLRKNAAVPVASEGPTYAFPAQTLRQRPDVHQAEAQIVAAAARVTAADAERYPSFNIGGSIGLASLTFAGLTGGGSLAAAILGGVSMPIFNAGALAAQVQVQDAALDQARIAYEATVLAALKDVEDALVVARKLRERLATLRRAAEAAKNASLLARFRYNSGLIDFTSVLRDAAVAPLDAGQRRQQRDRARHRDTCGCTRRWAAAGSRRPIRTSSSAAPRARPPASQRLRDLPRPAPRPPACPKHEQARRPSSAHADAADARPSPS